MIAFKFCIFALELCIQFLNFSLVVWLRISTKGFLERVCDGFFGGTPIDNWREGAIVLVVERFPGSPKGVGITFSHGRMKLIPYLLLWLSLSIANCSSVSCSDSKAFEVSRSR